MITLNALEAQMSDYISRRFEVDRVTPEGVIWEVLTVLLGEPNNVTDPRRSLVTVGATEIVEMLQRARDEGRTKISDMHHGRERAAGVAMHAVTDAYFRERYKLVGSTDTPWSLVADYLANIGGGPQEAIEDLEDVVSIRDLGDLLGDDH